MVPRFARDSSRGEPAPKIASTSARSLTGVVPTSMTVAPGLTNARVTNAGRPMAATRMSAPAATAGKSGVFEWQMVTVASRCSSSIAIGFPTISLRPMITACRPAIGRLDRSSISMTPDGVHGRRIARPCTSLPTLTG